MVAIPNFKQSAVLVFIEAIQTAGVVILFYGALPHLSIINGLIVSSELYILQTFGKCIWNSFQLKNGLTRCNNDARKVLFHFSLVAIQGGTMIIFIILFSKMGEWNDWKICILILLGAVFTLFGWCKLSAITNQLKQIDIPNNKECSMNAFNECIC